MRWPSEILDPGLRAEHAGARRGYTLMELLIAMCLLIVLGGGLATFLGHGVSTWRRAENRGRVHETARALLEGIADDLRSTAIRTGPAAGETWIRFLADTAPGGRQRLRFVRATSGEAADPILREGGRRLSVRTPAVVDGRNDAAEAREGLLTAPGGLMEVLYTMDPRADRRTVWRGTLSPVGGADSLFIDRNIEDGPPRPPPPGAASRGEGVTEPADAIQLSRVALPVAEDVLHVGFRFWTPASKTWGPIPPALRPGAEDGSAPSTSWDSASGGAMASGPASSGAVRGKQGTTRAVTSPRRAGSPGSPLEDDRPVFPEAVEVTVVIAETADLLGTRLAEDVIESGATLQLSREIELPLEPGDRFLLIDEEWVEIESVNARDAKVAPGGRGARSTTAAKHERGARVEMGSTFRRIVDIPGQVTGVAEVPDARRGRGSGRP